MKTAFTTIERTNLVNKLEDYITFPNVNELILNIAGSTLEEDIKAIERVNYGIEREAQTELFVKRLKELYPMINPSFLNMKHSKKYKGIHNDASKGDIKFDLSLPKFAIYSLSSPYCQLTVELSYRGWSDKNRYEGRLCVVNFDKDNLELPDCLSGPFESSIQVNIRYNSGNHFCKSAYNFTSVFMGIIPNKTRDRLKLVQDMFGKDVYIIAEADNWDAQKVPLKDPLVVGVKGDTCFLIDSFDTTPLEEYVKENFSSRKNGNRQEN